MAKENKVLKEIALLLVKNASYFKENGLNGKLKVSQFLFQYSKLSGKKFYKDLAFDIMDYAVNKQLLLEIQQSKTDFLNGVSGIGLFIMIMMDEGYFDTDVDEIVEIVDKRLYHDLDSLTRNGKKNNLGNLISILAYLKYRNQRIAFLNDYDRLLNLEGILLTEITVIHLFNAHEYDQQTLRVSGLLINEIDAIQTDEHLIKIKSQIDLCLSGNATKKKRGSTHSKIQYKMWYKQFKTGNSIKILEPDQQVLFTDIMKNQSNVAETFGNLTDLGLHIIGDNSILTNLYRPFVLLDLFEKMDKAS